MRVLFTSGNAYPPQQSGGAQSSTDQLVYALMKAGHEAAVMCRLSGGGWTEWRARFQRRLTRRRFSHDTRLGYPVFRTWILSETSEVVDRFRPDVAVVQSGNVMQIARDLEANGVPIALYFRNVEFDELGGDPTELRSALYIANSKFTAAKYEQEFGIHSTVIPPLVDPERYRVESSRETVTLINPYPLKGGNLALEIARRCPDIPFVFVESWELDDAIRAALTASLADLPNVTLRPRTNDMKSVYGKARILLAPSQWEEAWGRVASEAHCSGIPVLGSDRGGLPEAIGPGGTILAHDAPAEDWAKALRRMWDDKAEYVRLSEAARTFATRPEMNPDNQFATFLGVLEKAVSNRRD